MLMNSNHKTIFQFRLFERSLYYLLGVISVIKRKPENLTFSENPWHNSRTVNVFRGGSKGGRATPRPPLFWKKYDIFCVKS